MSDEKSLEAAEKQLTTRPTHATGEVSGGALDELLDELPDATYHRGKLGGYAESRRGRWWFRGCVVAVPLAISLIYLKIQHDIEAERFDIPFTFEKPADSARDMHWMDGRARLGLHRDATTRIVLPDRYLELAEDCKHAQVWVDVQNGRTVELKKIVGEIQQTPRHEPAQP